MLRALLSNLAPARCVIAMIVTLAATTTPSAQTAPTAPVGGGCTVPSGGTPGVPEVLASDPERPEALRLSFTCPLGSNTMFILFGKCLEGPEFPEFAITPCGSGCGQRIDSAGLVIDGRELDGATREGSLAVTVPNIASLAGTALCFQFLCFEVEGERARCREISQTIQITLP